MREIVRTLPGYWTLHADLGGGWDSSVRRAQPHLCQPRPWATLARNLHGQSGLWGQGLPALQHIIPKIWTVVICTCPPSSETPQRGAMRRQSLILWSLRISAHTEIIWMGATPWGCSFKVRDSPWMSKSWGKLPTPPLQRLATTTQPQGDEQPACRNLGHHEQFFLLPSQKKWSRQNPYNPASVKSSCIWNTEQKDSYHISDEDIRQVTCPRGRWLTYLSGKAYGIQSSQESSTNLVSWKSHI